MYRQPTNRKPDLFAVLVLLVTLGFGLTVTVQVISSDTDQVVKAQAEKTIIVPG